MNHKKYILWGVIASVLSSALFFYRNEFASKDVHQKRELANSDSQHLRNMQILKSIPLVKNVESPKSDEEKVAQAIDVIFQKIQKEAAARTEKLERGTHAKGSCFTGNFHIFSENELKSHFQHSDQLIAKLRKGIFSFDGDYPVKIRFANAKGTTESDLVGDVRGFSFVADFGNRISNFAGEGRQDFMLNTSPMFATNNVHEFYEMLKAIRLSEGHFEFVNPFYVSTVQKAVKFGELYQRADTKSYATEDYWSNLPYSHGITNSGTPADLVKFKAVRCDGAAPERESSVGKSPHFLQTDIEARAKAGQVCFLLQIQFFDPAKIKNQEAGPLYSRHPKWSTTDWIENGGELWDEAQLPFHTIGKIEIKPEASRISCDDWYVNTRLHSNPQNQPLGSVARVRTLIEEASRARRMEHRP